MTTKALRILRVRLALRAYVQDTHDEDIHGGDLDQCAADWAEFCSLRPSEMPKWWAAGCFEPEAAQEMIDGGTGVAQAKRKCENMFGEIETYAYHVSNGYGRIGVIKAV